MATYTEKVHPEEFLLSEAQGNRSRDNVILTGSAALVAGEVLGRKTTPVVAEDAANTGDGDAEGMTVTLGANYQVGTYVLTCTAESADAGTFEVLAPDGTDLGDATVAVEFSTGGHLTFTIPDGATDWATGDKITITVGEGLLAAYDQDGSDGTQVAVAINNAAADPSSGDVSGVATVRAAEVADGLLTWPSDIDADEKIAARAALATRGIVVRD